MIIKRLSRVVVTLLKWMFLLALVALLMAYGVMRLREEKTIEAAAPPQGHLMRAGDAKIYVQQAGPESGEQILLIHGTGAWSEIWRQTIDALAAQGFRVTAMDVPPFGFSEKLTGADVYTVDKQADRILAALASLHISRLTILCHSVGCRPSVEAALKKPELFEKVILVDAALGIDPDKDALAFQQNAPSSLARILFGSHVLRDAAIALYGTNPLSTKSIFSSFVYDASSVTPERVKMLQEPLALKGITRAEGDWLANLTIAEDHNRYTAFDFSTLTMPCLIIWGEQDTVTPLWQGKALNRKFANSKLVTIPNAGHVPYIEDVDAFNMRVLEFLQ